MNPDFPAPRRMHASSQTGKTLAAAPTASRFQHAVFSASFAALRQLPLPEGKEVAFVGRSNAGKSSAINTLTNRRRLAYVSKTPGRTQLINFFSLGNQCHLVDLPGYGYATAPQTVKSEWGELVAGYLASRESLAGLILIMDCRHPLKPLDRQLLEWLSMRGTPVHVLLTKADKLSRRQAADTLLHVRQALKTCYPQATAQLFSSLSRQGLVEAEAVIEHLLAAAADSSANGGSP